MLHTIQANDVIPILLPAVGWVAAATLVGMFPKDSWNTAHQRTLSHAWWH